MINLCLNYSFLPLLREHYNYLKLSGAKTPENMPEMYVYLFIFPCNATSLKTLWKLNKKNNNGIIDSKMKRLMVWKNSWVIFPSFLIIERAEIFFFQNST